MTATRVHAEAFEQLTRALINAAARGERPRCGDGETSHYWTSEHEGERQLAALWCAGCPVQSECLEASEP
jgi:hypothetical protein